MQGTSLHPQLLADGRHLTLPKLPPIPLQVAEKPTEVQLKLASLANATLKQFRQTFDCSWPSERFEEGILRCLQLSRIRQAEY